jgi:CRP/FNR family transcriptional regulator, cyclic AMP receptor protein
MASPNRVRLIDVPLEFTRHLGVEDPGDLAGVTLPSVLVSRGPLELDVLLRKHKAVAAIVLDGMLVHRHTIGGQCGIQLLGPGDVLLAGSELAPLWLDGVEVRAPAPARLTMLGEGFMAAAVRWPEAARALYESIGNQMRRLSSQLVICQLPRVDQRVLAMLWLLAESWGQVTAGGVRLPLTLTHETLGALVGARRPTVTLALRKLSQDGSIVHQDSGWLLLASPPLPATENTSSPATPFELTGPSRSPARQPSTARLDPSIAYAELKDTVRRLREQHMIGRQRTREQLKRLQSSRKRMAMARERISQDALSRRRSPPSA